MMVVWVCTGGGMGVQVVVWVCTGGGVGVYRWWCECVQVVV